MKWIFFFLDDVCFSRKGTRVSCGRRSNEYVMVSNTQEIGKRTKLFRHEHLLKKVGWGRKLRTALNVFLLASLFRVKL